jgi:hypothetical protein
VASGNTWAKAPVIDVSNEDENNNNSNIDMFPKERILSNNKIELYL